MPSFILKLNPDPEDDQYVEWSTIVEAPTSEILTEAKAIELYGRERLERAKKTGTSSYHKFECFDDEGMLVANSPHFPAQRWLKRADLETYVRNCDVDTPEAKAIVLSITEEPEE